MKHLILATTFIASLIPPATASYNGQPFSLITQSFASDFNSLPNLFAAQISGDSLQITAFNTTADQFLFAEDDGGIAIKLLDQSTTPIGGNGPFSGLDYNFQRIGSDPSASDLVLDASVGDQSGYYRFDGTNWNQLITIGTTMPGSTFDFSRFGEPHTSGTKTAFLGMSHDPSGTPIFRGVYLFEGGNVTKLVDSNDTLPDLGTFDGSSSQVGFDGSLVAFWGAFGTKVDPPTGIFSVTLNGTITKLSKRGDTIPGTAILIDNFLSPPSVSNGITYYVATDDSFNRYVMKSDGNAPVLIAKDGDTISGGGVISDLCNYPPLASGNKIVFDAKIDGLPAVIEYDGTSLQTAAVSTDLPQFIFSPPSSMVPVDFEGNLLAIRATSGNRSYLYLNQSNPAIPTLTGPRRETFIVDPGNSITLSTNVIGKGPLTYSWSTTPPTTTPELVLTNVSAESLGRGNFTLRISNENGVALYQPKVVLNVAPYFPFDLSDRSFFEGQTLNLGVSSPGGVPPFTFQWFKGDTAIPGQTSSNLSIPNVTPSDAGDYFVEVTNAKGTSRSSTSSVAIRPIPPNAIFGGVSFGKLVNDATFSTTRSLLDLHYFINPETGLISFTDLDLGLNGTRIVEIDSDGKPSDLLTKAGMEAEVGETLVSIKLAGYFSNGDALIHSSVSPAFSRDLLHRMTPSGFTLIADSANLPVTPATPFTPLYFFEPNVVSDRVVTVAPDGVGNNVTFSVKDGVATLLVDSTAPLTSRGISSIKTSYAATPRVADGILVNERDEEFAFVRVWKVNFSGTASIFLEKDLTLDGEPATLTTVIFLGEFDGWSYFTTNLGVIRVQGPTAERFRPKLPQGSSSALEITITDGQFFAKAISETITGFAIYRFRNETFEIVHDQEFFDTKPLRSQDLAIRAVRGNEVLLSATESFGSPPFLIFNPGAHPLTESKEPFVFSSSGITFSIPEDQDLYRSFDLKTWVKIDASGNYSIPYSGSEYFQFRLR